MALARTLIVLALTVSFFTFVAFFGRLPAFRYYTLATYYHPILIEAGTPR